MNDLNDILVNIHLYLQNSKTEQEAYENIKFIKQCGFKILVTSPKILPERFYDVIDIFYHDKENQLFVEEYEDVGVMYHFLMTDAFTLKFGVEALQKHGLAVLRAMIKGCKVALLNNIKYIIRIESDALFGTKSIENLKNIINEFKINNYDCDLIRTIHPNYVNFSLHLMLYKCQTFLDVFGQIENETDFRKELRNLGLGNKNPWLEEFLYLMFERARNEKNLNINYHEILDSQLLYPDTAWNTNQLCFTSVNGLLTDVCHVYKNGNFEKKIQLAAKNLSNEQAPTVYFHINYKNGDFFTFLMSVPFIGCWSLQTLDNVDEIDSIYIKHGDNDFHKKYIINFKENDNQTSILDINTNKSTLSHIELPS